MKVDWFSKVNVNKFLPGFLVASLVFGGTAIAVNVNNTPQGGYLLCANNKTRAVTFPGTLKCPSGSTAIEVPGQAGFQPPAEPTPSPVKSISSGSSAAGDPNCNLTFLQKNPSLVSSIVDKCSGSDLLKLQADLRAFDLQNQDYLIAQQKKIAELRAKATTTTDKQAADAAIAEAESLAAAVANLMAQQQASMAILANIVATIAKKVKA